MSATNQSLTCPISKVTTKYRRELFKTTASTTTIVLTSAKVFDIYLLNTNATSGTVQVSSSGLSTENFTLDLTVTGGFDSVLSNNTLNSLDTHIKTEFVHSNATVTITLNHATESEITLGMIMCGVSLKSGVVTQDGANFRNDKDESTANVNMNITQYYEIKQYLYENRSEFFVFMPFRTNSSLKDRNILYGQVSLSGAKFINNAEVDTTVKIKE